MEIVASPLVKYIYKFLFNGSLTSAGDRIFRSGMWLYLSQAVKLGGVLLIIPLIVIQHGQEALGVWFSVIAAVSFIHLSDVGMHLPWLNRLTRNYINLSTLDLSKDIVSGVGLFLLLGVAGFLVIATFGHIAILTSYEVELFIYLLAVNLFIFLTKILRSVLRVFNENHKAAQFEAMQDIGIFLVSFIALLFFSVSLTFLAQLQLSIVVTFFCLAGLRFLSDKRFENIWPSVKDILVIFLKIFPSGRVNLLSTSANALLTNAPVLIITGAFGPSAAAVLVGARNISNIPRQIMSVFHISSVPEFSTLYASEDLKGVKDLFRKLLLLTISVNGVAAAAIFMGGPYILENWLNLTDEKSGILFFYFSIWCITEGVKMVIHESLLGLDSFRLVGKSNIAAAFISLIIMYGVDLKILIVPVALIVVNVFWSIPVLTRGFLLRFNDPALSQWLLTILIIMFVGVSIVSLFFIGVIALRW